MNDMVVGKIEQLTNEFPKIEFEKKEDKFLKWLMNYQKTLRIDFENAIKYNAENVALCYSAKMHSCEEIINAYQKLK